jgi:hypothetical protein
MLALDGIVQLPHEHSRVHDRKVQLGIEQVMIDRHQIVRLGLSAERDEIVVAGSRTSIGWAEGMSSRSGNGGLIWPHCGGLNWPHLRPTRC